MKSFLMHKDISINQICTKKPEKLPITAEKIKTEDTIGERQDCGHTPLRSLKVRKVDSTSTSTLQPGENIQQDKMMGNIKQNPLLREKLLFKMRKQKDKFNFNKSDKVESKEKQQKETMINRVMTLKHLKKMEFDKERKEFMRMSRILGNDEV